MAESLHLYSWIGIELEILLSQTQSWADLSQKGNCHRMC